MQQLKYRLVAFYKGDDDTTEIGQASTLKIAKEMKKHLKKDGIHAFIQNTKTKQTYK